MSDVAWKAKQIIESNLLTDSHTYNMGTLAKQLIHEERNTAQNWKPLVDAIEAGRARDISDVPKVNKTPAFLISSGPSLDNIIEQLKDWEGGIFCSTSQATTLMYYGIEPTHIVALDPFCSWSEIAGVDWSKTRAKLIVNPSVWPDIIPNWPNEMILFLQNIGKRDSFYATTQKHMFTRRQPDTPMERTPIFQFLIRTEITLFACTPPCQMFTADILGYGRIFLAGCDYAYPHGKRRFTRWQPDAQGKWIKEEVLLGEPGPMAMITDNGLPSEQVHVYYKKNYLSAWRLSLQQMWSTDQGALIEVPRIKMDRVIKSQGMDGDPISQAEIIRRVERYLARVGAYVLRTPQGIAFIECGDPLNQLPGYMAAVRRKWRCPKCGSSAHAADDKDYGSAVCQACSNTGMQRVGDIDIESNMERITRLVHLAERDKKILEARYKKQDNGQPISTTPLTTSIGTALGTIEPIPTKATTAIS